MVLTRRWPGLAFGELDEAQRRFWKLIASGSRQVPSVDADGHLLGPYDVLLRAPGLGEKVAALGVHLRGIGLSPRLRVLAILVVGAHWQSEFEWWAWVPVARTHGLDEELVEAIRDHGTPSFSLEDDRLVYEVTNQLMRSGALDDATFRDVGRRLGETGTVELVVLVGYYCAIAWMMNTFQIPLPEGETYAWDR